MTHSMKWLEERTEVAYEEVSCVRVDISSREREAKRLHSQIVIVATLLVPLLVCMAVFASWFTLIGPVVVWAIFGAIGVRRLYWLRNVELPHLRKKYRRTLTEATEVLQRQEERRQLKLLNPKEYDRIEREAEEQRAKRERKEAEAELWERAFRAAVNGRKPYGFM